MLHSRKWLAIVMQLARIAQYAYEIGARTANLDHPPLRDNRGPRVGKTVAGKLKG